MKMTIKNNLFPAVFLIFIGLHLLLVCSLRIYPFIDLPFRLAAATIFKFYGESTNQFAEYYSIDTFPKPNIVHLLFCSLKIFPTVEFGNKIFYCLYVILLPLSVFLVIRKFGGNPWFSILSFLVLYNYNVSWGFAEFTISIPFVFLLFYFHLHYLDSDGIWIKILITALFLSIFFIHVLMASFCLLIFFVCYVHRYRNSFMTILTKSIVTVPLLIVILLWWKYDASHSSQSTWEYLSYYYKTWWLQTLAKRAGELFFSDNHSLYAGILGNFIAVFFSLFMIFPVFRWLLPPWKTSFYDKNNNRITALYLFLSCSLFCYLFLPPGIPGQFFLYQRFSVFFLISIIILGSIIYSEKFNQAKIFSICVVCLLHLIMWADYYRSFAKENCFFTRDLFPERTENRRLAGLIYDYQFRGRPIYIHFPCYFIIWNRGIATTTLIDFRFGSVRRKTGRELLPRYNEWIGKLKNYDDRYINMEYILVRGEIPKAAARYLKNFKLSKSIAQWSLYERQDCAP